MIISFPSFPCFLFSHSALPSSLQCSVLVDDTLHHNHTSIILKMIVSSRCIRELVHECRHRCCGEGDLRLVSGGHVLLTSNLTPFPHNGRSLSCRSTVKSEIQPYAKPMYRYPWVSFFTNDIVVFSLFTISSP